MYFQEGDRLLARERFWLSDRAKPAFVRVPAMERRVTVEFGPSRSKRFAKAVAAAQSGPGECQELEPGRYRVSFVLGTDSGVYAGLAHLLQWVRNWRATEVYEGEEPLPGFHTREMAWCASSQLKLFGECRFRFSYGVFPRCALCPLLEVERAVRDMLGENPIPPVRFDIEFGPRLQALMRGELDKLDQEFAEDWQVPDFPPEEWEEQRGDNSTG